MPAESGLAPVRSLLKTRLTSPAISMLQIPVVIFLTAALLYLNIFKQQRLILI